MRSRGTAPAANGEIGRHAGVVAGTCLVALMVTGLTTGPTSDAGSLRATRPDSPSGAPASGSILRPVNGLAEVPQAGWTLAPQLAPVLWPGPQKGADSPRRRRTSGSAVATAPAGPSSSRQASGTVASDSQIPPSLPPFQEAHWQGLEVVPLTRGLARFLKVRPDLRGVVVDDVTTPADLAGFLAGDVVCAVDGVLTPDLDTFIDATRRVRESRRTDLTITRDGIARALPLTALRGRLGTANGETAPMIQPGTPPPHGNKGPCTSCHRIGTTGQLAMDPGDLLSRSAPWIAAGQPAPHRDRGRCTSCHEVRP